MAKTLVIQNPSRVATMLPNHDEWVDSVPGDACASVATTLHPLQLAIDPG
jgi:hypothetical protein